MKGDFSRMTFDPGRRFTAVRAQQGAVQIDADANEQADIVTHRLDRTFRDIIGPAAGPLDPDSFKVTVAGNAITVSPGRYYVGGRLLENDAPVTLPAQPFLSGGYAVLAHPAAPAFDVAAPAAGEYAVVLDSWVRHVTVLEMPALLEPALGGVQTGTRHQSVWQLKLLKLPNGTSCGGVSGTAAWANYSSPSAALMEAGTDTPPPAADQCDLSPSGGYQGLENSLYRVEIHDGGPAGAGAGTATFKWARDNASFATLAAGWDNDRTVTLSSAPGDLTRGFRIGDTVELIDVETELRERPGRMLTVQDLVGDTMTLSAPHLLGAAADGAAAAARKLRVRRWEGGPLSIPKGTPWLALGADGVRVNFDKNVSYRTGEHWMIAARTTTNDIEWPGGAQPPANIPHLFAPLARIKIDGAGKITLLGDCRTLFAPLGAMISLLYVGGDGQQAEPNEAGNAAALPLAKPLTVAVMRGKLPVAGAAVRFTIGGGGGGSLNGGGASAVVQTDADGLASCNWALAANAGDAPQQVEARMLDDGGAAVANPVRFGARVLGLIEMKLAGGDTQTQVNSPGNAAPVPLAEPLRVAVTRANRPLPGALVRFTLVGGSGSLKKPGGGGGGAAIVDIQADADGIAACAWTLLPGAAAGRVRAQLMKNAVKAWGAPDVIFSASLLNLPRQGACCVTVGPGMEFERLEDAIQTLLDKNLGDICICLTAGDHTLSKPITVSRGNRPNLSIHGCGAATRLHFGKHSMVAVSMGALEIADLHFTAQEEVLIAVAVTSVALRRVTGTAGAFVLGAQGCGSITVEDCDLSVVQAGGAGTNTPATPAKNRNAVVAFGAEISGAELGLADGFHLWGLELPIGLGFAAQAAAPDLILIDCFEAQIRIVRNRLGGAINFGGHQPAPLDHRKYYGGWRQSVIKAIVETGGTLAICDNEMYDLRVTGEPARRLGLDSPTPKSMGFIRIPRLARFERNEVWASKSVLPAQYAYVDGNRFMSSGPGSEQLLVIAPTGSDGDPTVKIVGNSGPKTSLIVSTGFADKAANSPMQVMS
ncbi:MAG TPA: DUF6519 domain-containing protein [Allosphingosinicella sp.]|jgi:hypothetical protein